MEDRNARTQAEAAAWLAKLHSPNKTPRIEAAFRRWLDESDNHKAAFEQATAVWDLIPSASPEYRSRNFTNRGRRRPAAIAASLAALFATSSLWWIDRDFVYETRIGEQQLVLLEDKSRIALNTNSELEVKYSARERRIVLDRGEALFEVTKDASRPFIVVAGTQSIRALGTKFVVRQESGETRVTLLEGRVQVSGPAAPRRSPVAVLEPGQQVTITPTAGAALATPSLESITAWRRGEVVFEDASLIEVAAELNRYNEARLIISDPSLASMRISGVFATEDVGEVARAIAELHALKVERDGRHFKLKSS